MFKKIKFLTILALLLLIQPTYAIINAEKTQQNAKHPDYSHIFLGRDKFESFNRKMFIFNSKANKYVVRPLNTVWASIMPKYGMERIISAYTNFEYPKRVVSSLVQKDFKTAGRETARFLTNSTVGLGGLYDPAKNLLKIEPAKPDMEQALAKMKVKQGPYLVLPGLIASTPRSLLGRAFDTALDPSIYLGTPITAAVKAGVMLNKTAYMQPFARMIESTYADPYEIAKKLWAIENYIKNHNLYKAEVLKGAEADLEETKEVEVALNQDPVKTAEDVNPEEPATEVIAEKSAENILEALSELTEPMLADIIFEGYNPQSPMIDAMRTTLFEVGGVDYSRWSELSIWNRSFAKQVKTASIELGKNRDDYHYRYILQKDKTAPVVIIYPSIGEGINSHHSVVLAKIFHELGYSTIIQSSQFNWEFVKSAEAGYCPGIPSVDADYLRLITGKILDDLNSEHGFKPRQKVLLGTSLGAMSVLFVAEKEAKENKLDITKYIAISPPVELIYALNEVDDRNSDWHKHGEQLKHKVAITAAKVIKTINEQKKSGIDPNKPVSLPFSNNEAKLLSGFVMQQKLSDLIFTLENASTARKTGIYDTILSMSYKDYVQKYILKGKTLPDGAPKLLEHIAYETSLHSISEFLQNNDNYKIYHSVNDYFVNTPQLRQLKTYSANKLVLLDNGSHLGFLYRQEFISELKRDLALPIAPNNDIQRVETPDPNIRVKAPQTDVVAQNPVVLKPKIKTQEQPQPTQRVFEKELVQTAQAPEYSSVVIPAFY